jgi:hypothetical protein
MSRLRVIDEQEEIAAPQVDQNTTSPAQALQREAITMMFLALKTMSQKSLIALSNLFTMATAGSVFAVWLTIISDVTDRQIIAASIYSVFVLALNRWCRK